jgi:fibronectin type 3 domain-containing protein
MNAAKKPSPTSKPLVSACFLVTSLFACIQFQSLALTLTWRAPESGPEVAGYYVYMRESTSQTFAKVDVANATTLRVPNLIQGKTYTFYVTAFNSHGLESDPSNTFTYTVPSAPVPTGPQMTVEPISQYGFLLTWSSVEGASYFIWGKEQLSQVKWSPISTNGFITAIGPYTSYLVPRTLKDLGFYRIEELGFVPLP